MTAWDYYLNRPPGHDLVTVTRTRAKLTGRLCVPNGGKWRASMYLISPGGWRKKYGFLVEVNQDEPVIPRRSR